MKYDEIPQDLIDSRVIIYSDKDTSSEILDKIVEIRNKIHVFGYCVWRVEGQENKELKEAIRNLVQL